MLMFTLTRGDLCLDVTATLDTGSEFDFVILEEDAKRLGLTLNEVHSDYI